MNASLWWASLNLLRKIALAYRKLSKSRLSQNQIAFILSRRATAGRPLERGKSFTDGHEKAQVFAILIPNHDGFQTIL